MRIQPAPALATWLLKLFCSSAADESLVGDLLEKYRQGHGRLWYWWQVSAIAFVRLNRKVQQPSLSADALVKHGFAPLIVIGALSVVLLSDIWFICLVGILGGVLVGALLFLLGNRTNERRKVGVQIPMDPTVANHPGISITHIPVEGAVGLLFVFGTVFIFLVGVPAIRAIFVLTAPLGVVVFGVLHYWHKHHAVRIESLNLHK